MTALQPLAMYNSSFAGAEAKYFAERVRGDAGPGRSEQIRRAFEIALGRPPGAVDKEKVAAFFSSLGPGEDALVGLCRVLLNSNEFIYVD